MTNRPFLPSIKPFLVVLSLFCAFFSFAQRPVSVLFSPVSTLDGTQAQVVSVNTLSDSIVFVQVDIIPSRDFESLPNGISPQTVIALGNSFYPMNNVAQVMPDSMFPIHNPDGFQGWYDVKANNVYHLLLTFIVPSLTSVESFSILPSADKASDNSDSSFYSFADIKINSNATPKAFSAKTVKATKLLCEPYSKAKKLQKLPKDVEVCIIEGDDSKGSSISSSDNSSSKSEFYHVIVLSSGITGYVEKKALSLQGNPIELLTDVVKLSKRGDQIEDNGKSGLAEIECHNNTLTPINVVANNSTVTIDPLKTQTFRVKLEGNNGHENVIQYQYMVVSSEGLPPMIIRCNLAPSDTYHWEFVRASNLW